MTVSVRITNATTGQPVDTWNDGHAVAEYSTIIGAADHAARVVADLGQDVLADVIYAWEAEGARIGDEFGGPEDLDVTRNNVRVSIEVQR